MLSLGANIGRGVGRTVVLPLGGKLIARRTSLMLPLGADTDRDEDVIDVVPGGKP